MCHICELQPCLNLVANVWHMPVAQDNIVSQEAAAYQLKL